mmetsp:Transcript_18167/g.29495  ORF Transcript_18167/g.29495 Transcript_18167/m.29495 type:complete len:312 (+) Transcript_18167:342-1277(+)
MEPISEAHTRVVGHILGQRKLSTQTMQPVGQQTKYTDLFDVDCNLTHLVLRPSLDDILDSARKSGLSRLVSPGSCLEDSVLTIELCETIRNAGNFEAWGTVGVHPYNALVEDERVGSMESAKTIMKECAREAVAIGECGLDYSEGFPDKETQIKWFEPQVALACELNKPLFLHERLAHADFMNILGKYRANLPPSLVHCFTGNASELQTYLDHGFMISISGLICREKAGAPLRDAISRVGIPLDRVMVETDAPYLGFPGCNPSLKRSSVFPNLPSALPQVVDKLAEIMNIDAQVLAQATTRNALRFFRLVA